MASVSDDFNRANAATLGWSEQSTSLNWGIFSNEAGPRSTTATWTYHPTSMDSDAMFAQATLRATAASTFHALVLACGALGTTNASQGGGYGLYITGAAQDSLSIRRKANGATTLTVLATVTRAMVAGDVIRFERDANGAMRAYVNGTQITGLNFTDTTFTGSGFRRVGFTSSAAGVTAVRYDDFSAGDIVAPAAATPKRRLILPQAARRASRW